MSDDREKLIQELFHAAVALPREDRIPYLRQACGGDDSLFAELESLLASDVSYAVPFDEPAIPLAEIASWEVATEKLPPPIELSGILTPSVYPGSLGRLGKYEILEILGRGGMGTVLRAFAPDLSREVAIKIQTPGATIDSTLNARFLREAKTIGTLNHPNVVTVFDFNEDHSPPFLVMELLQGKNLADKVRLTGTLEPLEALRVISLVAGGMSDAHAKKVIHRDIKPQNIFETDDGKIKVLDLGVAKQTVSMNKELLAAHPTFTVRGDLVGTIDFMSPEQALDATQADERSDVYSLGCTLFYLIEGRPLFDGNPVEKLVAHREQIAPNLSPKRFAKADVEQRVNRLLQRMLAKNPGDRPANMQEVLGEIEAIINTSKPLAPGFFLVSKTKVAVASVLATAFFALLFVYWNRPTPYEFDFGGIVDPVEIETISKLYTEIKLHESWKSDLKASDKQVAHLLRANKDAKSFRELMRAGTLDNLSNVNRCLWLLDSRFQGIIPQTWKDRSEQEIIRLIHEELDAIRDQERRQNIAKVLNTEVNQIPLRRWNIDAFPTPNSPQRQDSWLSEFSDAVEEDVLPLKSLYERIKTVREFRFGSPTGSQMILRTTLDDIDFKGTMTTANFELWAKVPFSGSQLFSASAPNKQKKGTIPEAGNEFTEIRTGVRLNDAKYLEELGKSLDLDWQGSRAFVERDKFRMFLGTVGFPKSFLIENETLEISKDRKHPNLHIRFGFFHQDLTACRGQNGIEFSPSSPNVIKIDQRDISSITAQLPTHLRELRQFRSLPFQLIGTDASNVYRCKFPLSTALSPELHFSFTRDWEMQFSGLPTVAERNAIIDRLGQQSELLRTLKPLSTVHSLRVVGSPAVLDGILLVRPPLASMSDEEIRVPFAFDGAGELKLTISPENEIAIVKLEKSLPKQKPPLTESALREKLASVLLNYPKLKGFLKASRVEVGNYGAFVTLSLDMGDWPELVIGPLQVSTLEDVPVVVAKAVSNDSLIQFAKKQWPDSIRHPRFGNSRSVLTEWNAENGVAMIRTTLLFGSEDLYLEVLEKLKFGDEKVELLVYDIDTEEWRDSDVEAIAASLKPKLDQLCSLISTTLKTQTGLDVQVGVEDRVGNDWLSLSPPAVTLQGSALVPLIDVRVGLRGVRIDETGITVSSIPLILERSFYFPNFAISNPRVEFDFGDKGIRLGITVTPPMLPVGNLFQPNTSISSSDVVNQLDPADQITLQDDFGGLGNISRIRWDNLWLHIFRGELDVGGSLQKKGGIGRNAIKTSSSSRSPRQTLDAKGSLVFLDSNDLANCNGNVAFVSGSFDSLRVSAMGDFSLSESLLNQLSGEFVVHRSDGASLRGVAQLDDYRIDGSISFITTCDPPALMIAGETLLPVVGVARVHGMSNLSFSDFNINANGSLDVSWGFGVSRLNYQFVATEEKYYFDWWWTTPDGREVHYRTEGADISLLDASQLLDELEAVVKVSLDPNVVKELEEEETSPDPPLPGPTPGPDPTPGPGPNVPPGQDDDGTGEGATPSFLLKNTNRPKVLSHIELDTKIEGELLTVSAKDSDVTFGRITTGQAGVSDWSRCLVYRGWTEKNLPELLIIEFGSFPEISRVVPVVFNSVDAPEVLTSKVPNSFYEFARSQIGLPLEADRNGEALWLIAEAAELIVNGWQVDTFEVCGTGVGVNASRPDDSEKKVGVFVWTTGSNQRRMSAFSSEVSLENFSDAGSHFMYQASSPFEDIHSFADVVVAKRESSAELSEDDREIALARQLSRFEHLLQQTIQGKLQSLRMNVIHELPLNEVRARLKLTANMVWKRQITDVKKSFVGPRGVALITEKGWWMIPYEASLSDLGSERFVPFSVFETWSNPSLELLPPSLQTTAQRKKASQANADRIAQECVTDWDDLKTEKEETRWLAHPMGLLLELSDTTSNETP